jgi:hypothetical protein
MLPPSGSRRSPMTLSEKPRDNNHGSHYPGTARLPGRTLGSLFASPLPPFHTSLPTRVYPGSKSVTSFAVERYFIRPAKCEACVQHDKRDEQRSVLNWHRRNHYSPKPYKTPPGLRLSINTWLLFMITITANHNPVSTYNSQVTGNHPTSTGLSMAKQFTRSWPNRVKDNLVAKVIMQQRFHSTPIT